MGSWAGRGPRIDDAVMAARAGFAELIGVPAARVTIGRGVSPLVGLLAASLPDPAWVLVPTEEFTSLTWPFAAQAGRGVVLTETSRDQLPERATGHDLVVLSAVASADGALADLDALATATAKANTRCTDHRG